MRRRTVLSMLGSAVLTACGVPTGVDTPAPVTPAPVTPSPRVPVQVVMRTTAPYYTHDVIECDVVLQDDPVDVFDTRNHDLWLRAIHTDTQTTLRVPIFWLAEYDETIQPTDITGWRARLTLPQGGTWQIQANYGALTSAVVDISIGARTDAHGMVRVHPRGFAFDDDTAFVPIGVNLGWSTAQGAEILADYERWFRQLAANGGNAARIWMASWAFGIEWNDTPLGDYRNRMRQAWLLDRVFMLAQRYNIRIMLCFINHGAFSTTTNAEWQDNPYNQANGGPLVDPAAFMTDAAARNLWHKRVAYIAARYAAYPSLWCWEWWNEIDWTPIKDEQLAPWLRDSRALIQQFDPYQHPITSSWSSLRLTELWAESTLDFVQHHTYEADDVARTINTARIPVKHILRQKPLLVSEIGLNAGGATTADAIERIHLHNALWAPLMLGTAGSGMYWWWDTWLDPNNHWGAFASVSTFTQGMDMRTMRSFSLMIPGATSLGLRNDTIIYLWVRHAKYTAKEALRAYALANTTDPQWQYTLAVQAWPSVTIKDVDDGSYDVHWFDPQRATWQPMTVVNAVADTLALDVPDFAYDMAVKITRRA
ncbi:MAG: hypothetical protein ACK5GU_10890 [Chloroflexota bacterium]|jgi:hypothetical protein